MKMEQRTGQKGWPGRRWILPLSLLLAIACEDGGMLEPPVAENLGMLAGGRSQATATLTGSVDLVWPGGKGAGAPDEDRIAQADITAFAGVSAGAPGPGEFIYRVIALDGTPHREIGVELTWVGLDDQTDDPRDIRFIGVVVSDTKPCGGSGHGGGGGCGDDGGGCDHDDGSTHDDGGCSHDDGSTHDDGGCDHDDGSTHDDGGCDGGSGGSGDHGEPGGPGGPGGKVTGRDCRLGQIVIGWMLDGGTPATMGDRVSWKWMAPDAPKVLAIQEAIEGGLPIPWPCKLCEKVILGGNLKLHLR